MLGAKAGLPSSPTSWKRTAPLVSFSNANRKFIVVMVSPPWVAGDGHLRLVEDDGNKPISQGELVRRSFRSARAAQRITGKNDMVARTNHRKAVRSRSQVGQRPSR